MLRHLSVPYRNFTATAQDARWLPAVCEFDEAKLGLEIAHGRAISIPALNGGGLLLNYQSPKSSRNSRSYYVYTSSSALRLLRF